MDRFPVSITHPRTTSTTTTTTTTTAAAAATTTSYVRMRYCASASCGLLVHGQLSIVVSRLLLLFLLLLLLRVVVCRQALPS